MCNHPPETLNVDTSGENNVSPSLAQTPGFKKNWIHLVFIQKKAAHSFRAAASENSVYKTINRNLINYFFNKADSILYLG